MEGNGGEKGELYGQDARPCDLTASDSVCHKGNAQDAELKSLYVVIDDVIPVLPGRLLALWLGERAGCRRVVSVWVAVSAVIT